MSGRIHIGRLRECLENKFEKPQTEKPQTEKSKSRTNKIDQAWKRDLYKKVFESLYSINNEWKQKYTDAGGNQTEDVEDVATNMENNNVGYKILEGLFAEYQQVV
jgi:hypothetical protein